MSTVIDAGGFNDFTVNAVKFSHYPGREGPGEKFYKVWWPDVPGAGRLCAKDGVWEGYDTHFDRSFRGVESKAEAVRRMVAQEWDPEVFPSGNTP